MPHWTDRRSVRHCFARPDLRIASICVSLIAGCYASLAGFPATAQSWTPPATFEDVQSYHPASEPHPLWAEQPVGSGVHRLPADGLIGSPVETHDVGNPFGMLDLAATGESWAQSTWATDHPAGYADVSYPPTTGHSGGEGGAWTWQVMPLGLIYRSYLGSVKESRFASVWSNDSRLGDIWDAVIGGRIGLIRYGTSDAVLPEGWQIDLEGAAQSRLDPHAESTPLLSTDFRVGIPVTYGRGRWQFKTGYYHISSHLGDEFVLMDPETRRLNYTRDSILLGVGWYYTERLRLYVETAYAMSANDGAEPWELQYGLDWAPARDTGLRGAPFFAANAHLREEVDFGGHVVLQTGWSWRHNPRGSLFRLGLQYFKGKSEQYQYYDYSEERFGWGMWADF